MANGNHDEASAMGAAKDLAQRRTSNQIQMNQEDHPNLRYDVHPDEPNHSQPSSQRILHAKKEREADDGTSTADQNRSGSIIDKIQHRG